MAKKIPNKNQPKPKTNTKKVENQINDLSNKIEDIVIKTKIDEVTKKSKKED